MPQLRQFKLPDVGEGLTEGEILKWLVQPGDRVTDGQPIVEIETAKAAVELPSPFDGVVAELHFPEGATVDVGAPIVTVDTDPDGAGATDPGGAGGQVAQPPTAQPPTAQPPATAPAMADDLVPDIGKPADDEAVEPGIIGGPAPGGRTSVLVGYGPRSTEAVRRPRKNAAPPAAAVAAQAAPAPPPAPAPTDPPPIARTGVVAKPPVRKLARDLGVDLGGLVGSGQHGAVTREDVYGAAANGSPPSTGPLPAPSFDPATREHRIPVKGVRKHTAAAMVASAFTAPHVTEFLTIDMTPTMRLRERVAGSLEFSGVKVSPLLFVAKALITAVKRHPMINSSWDAEAGEIVVKEYVNLGIATATGRGLIVPNIKDAGCLSLRELADALAALTETTRAGKATPEDLAGGTISITNVGVFGVDTGTPILPPGETAILALGAVRPTPWVHEGEIAIRQVTQLALSFDHRVVDGQLGSLFLAEVGLLLADPAMAAVLG
ncbi:MAG: dihydrolipoamide acetyltransferase family protein [Mycobacteriales bacterium]|nr:MAG: branched-chain alpha-keto acid dehydrogenase subunit E2 [Pseudonocardiales bacterium]